MSSGAAAICPEQRFISVWRKKWPRWGTRYLILLCAAQLLFSNCSALDSSALDTCRPAPVTLEERKAILDSLPSTGDVTRLTSSNKRKLDSVTAVLRLHQRDDVYYVKVIDVPQAWIGLYERVVLLISLPLLRLVDANELRSLTAHEIGHEYVAQEYALAMTSKDKAGMRRLELRCDAIATVTLVQLGMKPDLLVKALAKMAGYNRDRFGRAENEDCYPLLNARREYIQEVAAALKLSSFRASFSGCPR